MGTGRTRKDRRRLAAQERSAAMQPSSPASTEQVLLDRPAPLPENTGPEPSDETMRLKGSALDPTTARERFERRKSWFVTEMRRQEHNRFQMALDEDYYDGLQWTAEEIRRIKARGQDPTVYNEVFPTINFLIGTEARTRRDFRVLARHDNRPEAATDAELKTKLLKYLEDVNRAPFQRSEAAKDAWKAGVGWIEVGVRADPEDEPIYKRREEWRNIVYDSLASEKDLSDSRFMFRLREVDLDVAIAFFPDKATDLTRAARQDGEPAGWHSWLAGYPTSGVIGSAELPARMQQYDASAWEHNPRKRVLLIECWCFEPKKQPGRKGVASSYDPVKMQMHVSIMTEHTTILEMESPYRHNRFPFVPIWAYRRGRDRAPYSPVRQVRGPQDGINKFMSKARFLLSANQLRVEKGAIDPTVMDKEELRDEMASPDGVLEFATGALEKGRVQIREHGDIANGHVMMADKSIAAVRSVGGVNEENRGLQSSATSRVAMDAKADRGSIQTAELIDNLFFAHQLEGELTVSLIEQYYTERKVFSITGERYSVNYEVINDVDPATGERINDVTQFKAQFVIADAPWRQSLAAAAFESAMEMLGNLAPVMPEVAKCLIDLVFEWSDLPNKETILKRLRETTGMPDPDEGESEEQQAIKQQQQAMAQAQFEAQMADLRATIREAEARGEKLSAEAMAKRLESIYMAAQAAQVLTLAAPVAPVADQLLREAGFQGAAPAGQDPSVIEQPALPAPAEQDPSAGMTVGPDAQGGGAAPMPELQQTDGARTGIETPGADGVVGMTEGA
jgi:hypothetical protein